MYADAGRLGEHLDKQFWRLTLKPATMLSVLFALISATGVFAQASSEKWHYGRDRAHDTGQSAGVAVGRMTVGISALAPEDPT